MSKQNHMYIRMYVLVELTPTELSGYCQKIGALHELKKSHVIATTVTEKEGKRIIDGARRSDDLKMGIKY